MVIAKESSVNITVKKTVNEAGNHITLSLTDLCIYGVKKETLNKERRVS